MGCGCNKARSNGALSTPRAVRRTVYQVIKNGAVVSEFGTLAEARTEAVSQDGQVRVSSKLS